MPASPAAAGVPGTPLLAVVGGGASGVAYLRQLLRATAAGRLHARQIVIVDRDPACAVAPFLADSERRRRLVDPRGARPVPREPGLELAVSDWSDWLDRNLGGLEPTDHLVPYHWAPHLLLGWLTRQVEGAGGEVRREDPPEVEGLPFARATQGGDRALSYATWLCPEMCIEPARCPHTRGERDWSLLARLVRPGEPETLVFPCVHLAWGVASIPVARILAARDRVIAGLAGGPHGYRVATASHCHGLAAAVEIRPRSLS